MSDFRIDKITNRAGDAGTQIAGISTFSGTSGIQLPSGPTAYRGGRGRGIMSGGSTPTNQNVIEYIEIGTTGTAKDFGDLNAQRAAPASCASSTRAIIAGGFHSSYQKTIDYVTISSGGGAAEFGNMIDNNGYNGATSDSTRGIIAGGWASARGASATSTEPYNSNRIEFVTISTLGNSSDFGDLTMGRQTDGGLSNTTRGVFISGATYHGPLASYPSYSHTNIMDYITIQSKGNAEDFGDTGIPGWGSGKCSNTTRGIIASGYTNTPSTYYTAIHYITTATKGNSLSFGTLDYGGKSYVAGMASAVRGVFAGGGPGPVNDIEYVTIPTLGNSVDFGTLGTAKSQVSGSSDVHGGLG